MVRIFNFMKYYGMRSIVACVLLLAVGVFSTPAGGASYEEEMGMTPEDIIDTIFGHGGEEDMYGAIIGDREYEDTYGPLARLIEFVRTLPAEVSHNQDALRERLMAYYAPVLERGIGELDPGDVSPEPRDFLIEEIDELPVDPDRGGSQENA
ncbi:MAG: hypothetical protein LBB15_01085, partial [Puniceicoccales bacterium]|nr:hypothetical protein [Puniceicoccales bacterium]